jgi:hypothetical protein
MRLDNCNAQYAKPQDQMLLPAPEAEAGTSEEHDQTTRHSTGQSPPDESSPT